MNHLVRLSSFTVIATLAGALTQPSTAHAYTYPACFSTKQVRAGTFQWADSPTPLACLSSPSGPWCIDLGGPSPVGVGEGIKNRAWDRTTSGRHTARSVDARSIEVCTADATNCHRVDFVDIQDSEYVSSAVDYDGARVVVARRALHADEHVLETYDVAMNRRTSRREIRLPEGAANQIAGWFKLHWVGDFVYLGNESVVLRLDLPRAPKKTIAAAMTSYRFGGDFAQINRSILAMVSRDLGSVQLLDGKFPSDHTVPLPVVTTEKATVWVHAFNNELYLLYEAPVRASADPTYDGTVLRVDLRKKQVVERRSLNCPSASPHGEPTER